MRSGIAQQSELAVLGRIAGDISAPIPGVLVLLGKVPDDVANRVAVELDAFDLIHIDAQIGKVAKTGDFLERCWHTAYIGRLPRSRTHGAAEARIAKVMPK